MLANWERDPDDPTTRHRGGIPWFRQRMPWRLHRCVAQTATVSWTDKPAGGRHVTGVVRCACGAVANSDTGGRWTRRNSRRAGTSPSVVPGGLLDGPTRA